VALAGIVGSPARAQVADGGPVDGGAAAAVADAAAAEVAPAPTPEVTKVPEPPSVAASRVATMMLATPAPIDTEPPRPITRRLWFWLAIAGVIAGGVLIGIAVHNPDHTKPECPSGYVCPP
jgi:hypothetical protein